MPDGTTPGTVGLRAVYSPLQDGTSARVLSPTPSAVGADDSVAQWDLTQKLLEAARLAQRKLPEEMQQQFGALFSPENLAITAGVLTAWALSHWVGIGEIVDVILVVAGVAILGWQAVDAAKEIGRYVAIASAARSRADLDAAAGHLARAVTIIGVAAFVALVFKYGRRLGGGAVTRFLGKSMDEWMALLGKSGAPLPVRERVGVALKFFEEHFPNMSLEDVASRLKGIDFSLDVKVTVLPAGTELIAYGNPARLGSYYTRVGSATNRLGIADGAREFMRFRLTSDAVVLESRATGMADTWTTGSKQLVGGGGTQYVLPSQAVSKLELQRLGQ